MYTSDHSLLAGIKTPEYVSDHRMKTIISFCFLQLFISQRTHSVTKVLNAWRNGGYLWNYFTAIRIDVFLSGL